MREGIGQKGAKNTAFLLLFAQYPRALTPLGLKETETTATQAIGEAGEVSSLFFYDAVVELKMRLAFALSENSFIRLPKHLTVTYCNE